MITKFLPGSRGCRWQAALAMLLFVLFGFEAFCNWAIAAGDPASSTGLASWYGEEHRGRLMANGKPFDPDKLTAASWFYPLGTQVRVTVIDASVSANSRRSVVVTITDRGPAKRLVGSGRIIDLSRAAFQTLATSELGLIQVEIGVMPPG